MCKICTYQEIQALDEYFTANYFSDFDIFITFALEEISFYKLPQSPTLRNGIATTSRTFGLKLA